MTEQVKEVIKHISEKPWSDYTEADYTIEQWHRACLVHIHDGPPTSKTQCKLPVKTPNGALNRNGVHAAAAALAGARSPLKAPPDKKAAAASALRRLYGQLGEKAPPSLAQSNLTYDKVNDIIEHHGVKGMHWGIRNKSRQRAPASSDFKKTAPHRGKPVHTLTNKQLKSLNERMNLEQNYRRMNPTTRDKGKRAIKGIIGAGTTIGTVYAMYNSGWAKHLMSIGKRTAAKKASHKLARNIASGGSFR